MKYDRVKLSQVDPMLPERIGPYRITRLLGKGGMGAVYEGMNDTIERRVAIKVLHPELAKRADLATRFINEARAVNRIDHPSMVQVSDYGQLPDGTAYIVMEFLKGETVGQRLKRLGTRFSWTDLARMGRQMAAALAAAHDKEIVHRDLKPDNLMLVPNAEVAGGEQIKVLDFGIAKLTELSGAENSEQATRADALLGTPRYMSPEQCRGGGLLDAKSDVYSLGVIFYELLAGEPPFKGTSHGELIVQHVVNPPPPLAGRIDPGTPEPLLQVVFRMLAKDKEHRPTMRQVAAELDRLSGMMSGTFGALSSQLSGGNFPSQPGAGSLPGFPSQAGPSLPGGVVMQQMPGPPSGVGTPSLSGAQHPSLAGMTGHASTPSTLGLAVGQTAPRPRWPIAVAIGSVIGALTLGVILAVPSNKLPPQVPIPLAQPKQESKPPPQPPPQIKRVHWTVSSTPEGAMVVRTRDGTVLGITPLSMTNDESTGTEQVRVVLSGHQEGLLQLDRSKDCTEQVALKTKTGKTKGKKKGYVPSDLTVLE